MLSGKKTLKFIATLSACALFGLGILGFVIGVRAVPVLTGSMRPHYPAGTLVFTRQVPTSSLQLGDVIAFAPPEPYTTPNNRPVMHRIVDIKRIKGDTFVWTRGDANPAPDPWTLDVTSDASHESLFSVPQAGKLISALKNPNPFIAAMTIAGLVLIGLAYIASERLRDEEEAMVAGFKFEMPHEYDEQPTAFGSAAHELRTALTHVATSVELARDEVDMNEQQGLLEIAMQGTARLTSVVEKLMFAFGMEKFREEVPVGIEKIVRGAVADLKLPENRIWLIGSPVSSVIRANEIALRRAIHGMLEHAIFVSGESNDIMVEVVECSNTVTVIVSATPVESMLYRIDQWPRESSLNLALVQRVAIDHGGQVEVESKLSGVSVSLTLPLIRGRKARVSEPVIQ